MRAAILRFYNKRLSEPRASEQNQEQPMGAGWTAWFAHKLRSKSEWRIQECHGLKGRNTNVFPSWQAVKWKPDSLLFFGQG